MNHIHTVNTLDKIAYLQLKIRVLLAEGMRFSKFEGLARNLIFKMWRQNLAPNFGHALINLVNKM